MTAAALSAPALGGRDAQPPLRRLTLVEMRKMTDTRAGFWLQLAVVALTLAIAGIMVAVGDAHDHTFETMFSAAMQPSVNLLPVIGILLVSSEWSQRTAQQTFTLVPRRPRVVAAKLLASLVVAAAAFAVSIVVALLATAIAGSDAPGTWSLPAGQLAQMGLLFAFAMVGGVAFGALLLASAPAIVAYFLAPTAWAALLSISTFEDLAPWLDGSRSYAPMSEGAMSATEWAHVATTTALWIGVPLALGIARIRRNEVP
jgi:ABC-type transport system involved in multi-copper enzyme maturation permease subunit